MARTSLAEMGVGAGASDTRDTSVLRATVSARRTSGLGFRQAGRLAIASDTLSITTILHGHH